jgi:hypothetical protein
MDNDSGRYVTGSWATAPIGVRSVTDKEKIELWFIDPLSKMQGDDAFLCLIVCLPLLETIFRYEEGVPDNQGVMFSENSPALKWFAKFLTIPESASREIWDAVRNGLLHRAMVKGTLNYGLTGRGGRPAEHKNGQTTIYIWDLRDKVVSKLREHHRKLWKGTGNELPNIYIRG